MAQGTVKWFNEGKGFGFIAPDDGSDDLFIHSSNVLPEGEQSLTEGAKVEFESRPGRKGQEAYDVRVINA
jgi:CspA family cold shock protein